MKRQLLSNYNYFDGIISFEKEDKYFEIAEKRIKGNEPNPNGFEKAKERGIFSFTDEPDKAD